MRADGPRAYSIDLRCPSGWLLGKIVVTSEAHMTSSSLIELSCRHCRNPTTRDRVLHRFSAVGELVETIRLER